MLAWTGRIVPAVIGSARMPAAVASYLKEISHLTHLTSEARMATQTMQPTASLGTKWSFFIFSKKAKLETCLEPYTARSLEKKANLGSLKPPRLRKVRDSNVAKTTKPKQRGSPPARSLLSLFRSPAKTCPAEPVWEAPAQLPKSALEVSAPQPQTTFTVQATYQQSIKKLRSPQGRPLAQLLLINQMVARMRLDGQGFGFSSLRRRSPPLIQLTIEDDDVPIAYLRSAPLKSPTQ